MKGAIAKAEEIAASDPDRYVTLKQFENRQTRQFTNKLPVLKFGCN
ncbi:Cysteine synthase [Mannheimia haemolytica]|uniref:Cysteine synthase n=1 Tax=Mannheimia haemolytica TaxID=75985 RepID=A0A378N7U2_MANHA|nr:Cysteine synthase [Mannheimia haemolytica]